MSSVQISGNASGAGVLTIAAPNTASNFTLTLPTQTGTILTGSGAISVNASSPNSSLGIDAQGYLTNPVNGNGIGRVQAFQYYRLNSDVVGSNATGAQSLFGVGVTLVGSMTYEFEIEFILFRQAGSGTTSHTIALGFGGTATLNNIVYDVFGSGGMTSVNTTGTGAIFIIVNTAASTVFTGAQTNTTNYASYLLKGTVSINAGGTFIPQYTLSAAPQAPGYSTLAGSYMKIAAIGVSASNNSIGSWA